MRSHAPSRPPSLHSMEAGLAGRAKCVDSGLGWGSADRMGFRARRATVLALAGMGILACGGGGGAPAIGLEGSPDDAGESRPRRAGAGAACHSDADCPAGFTCESIQLGEITQAACVPSALDGGGVVVVDATPPSDATSPSDADSPGDTDSPS